MRRDVKTQSDRRTRRSERAEATRRRILEAAAALFDERGYASTTIEAIAADADVAVETVYSRFGNKATLLEAILEPAIVGANDGRDLFDRPEIADIRSCRDQRAQIRMLARFSRGILERTAVAHRILRSAAASDAKAAELQRRDTKRRGDGQRVYIDMLLANGPLREELTPEEAAATYSALSNPSTYALLVGERGWTPHHFEQWLGDSLTLLLLPHSTGFE
ncbi:MAG: TetR/AcrR family transcriptional regulator [Actinomycetota bacterium]|nr:TetR/AcrR family transcriptional regulator [Actinomycetota bacterium]